MPITYDIKTDGLYLQGVEEGVKRSQLEMVKNCFHHGLTVELTASLVNLPEAQVQNTFNQLKK